MEVGSGKKIDKKIDKKTDEVPSTSGAIREKIQKKPASGDVRGGFGETFQTEKIKKIDKIDVQRH